MNKLSPDSEILGIFFTRKSTWIAACLKMRNAIIFQLHVFGQFPGHKSEWITGFQMVRPTLKMPRVCRRALEC